VRAAATVAGGLQHDHGTCGGGAAAIMYTGTGDNENPVVDMVNGFDVGTGQARDIFRRALVQCAADGGSANGELGGEPLKNPI
jgi:hypothetical protein